MKFRMSIRLKLFLSHLVVVVLVSGSIGTFFYLSAAESLMKGLQDRLRSSAAIVSRTIDAQELGDIRGESDISNPVYTANLQKLRNFRRMNTDIAYLYVMRRIGDKVVFIIDSDETERQALPGREYEDVMPSLMQGFTGVSVDDRIYTDEWGSFLSGYAPIENGTGEYLVGIDMRANEVQDKFAKLRMSGLISLTASLILALIFSRFLTARLMVPVRMLIARCQAIAKGRLGERIEFHTSDELNNLIVAFNDMSEELSVSEQRKQEAYDDLRRARDELEIRVQQRTKDLKEVNDKLSREIAERIRAERALEQAAMTDPLTLILNRRAMMNYLRHEMARNQRGSAPFVILVADLDHFKRVNDTEGHDVGDEVLIEAARRLTDHIRGQDTVARWGGEEFLILLPDTDLEGGVVAAEKMRARMAAEPYYVGGKEIRLTISIGAAGVVKDQEIEALIKAADVALYRAKNLGRNRVEVAPS